jgi:hypothetical protein
MTPTDTLREEPKPLQGLAGWLRGMASVSPDPIDRATKLRWADEVDASRASAPVAAPPVDRAVMQQALEALEGWIETGFDVADTPARKRGCAAIESLRAALSTPQGCGDGDARDAARYRLIRLWKVRPWVYVTHGNNPIYEERLDDLLDTQLASTSTTTAAEGGKP